MKLFQIRYRLLQCITIIYLSCIIPADAAALLALSSSETGLHVHGLPHLILVNGGIHVNSCGIEPVEFIGYPVIEAEYINIVGLNYMPRFNLDEGLMFNGIPAPLHVGVTEIEDPYAYLPEPFYGNLPDLGTIASSGTYNPGYYSGGMQVVFSNVILNPGIYILDGNIYHGGLEVHGGSVTAQGVMFYIVGGQVDLGNTMFELTPSDSGIYAGISIFQSRTNISEARIYGRGGINMTGTLYFSSNHLSLAGEGDTIGSQIIADSIEVEGVGEIFVDYNGPNEYIPWDLDFSGGVNSYDLFVLSYEWLQTTRYDKPYFLSDINADRNVDLNDFTILASHWMQCCGYP